MASESSRAWSLGLPLWGQANWAGVLYPPGIRARDQLAEYARVFDAVEGNTTFYSLPSEDTVARWREGTPTGFRFAFKFPRSITHDRRLQHVDAETGTFLERLAPLGARCGAFMLQLPPGFGPDRLRRLDDFLAALPAQVRCAVEVRHRAFFSAGAARDLEAVLGAHRAERVIMDTRGMRSGNPEHPDVLAAAHEKPDVPVWTRALGAQPLVRYVGHPEASVNAPWLAAWAERLATWIAEGRHPVFFMHCPDNRHSPALARWLDQLVRMQVGGPALPAFPRQDPVAAPQLSLL
ncbi:MAG: DUF72 domain-containing protein [Pseudomonadales bacterium]|jgi:uncharacterized protein YecE (DUF72 family)|nr:DUF72 domain-containing protein [Pseudomonadales bacterium]